MKRHISQSKLTRTKKGTNVSVHTPVVNFVGIYQGIDKVTKLPKLDCIGPFIGEFLFGPAVKIEQVIKCP